MSTVTVGIFSGLLLLCLYSTLTHGSTDKVVCYHTQWSFYREREGKFTTNDIDPFLCTHYIYAFAGIGSEGVTNSCHGCILSIDPHIDYNLNGFRNFTGIKLQNPKARIMLSLGGWKEGSQRFSDISHSDELRKEFSRTLYQDLKKYGFDGVDFCWQYPSYRIGSRPEDRENYVKLVKQVKETFIKEAEKDKKERMVISLVVPSLKSYLGGFDLENLGKHVDFMNIVNYDYHLSSEPVVYHHSPLYPIKEDSGNEGLNVDGTIQHYISLGADPSKLTLGIPTYGRSMLLEEADVNNFGSSAMGEGPPGPITKSAGFLAYYEICSYMKELGWTVMRPNASAVGPYMFKNGVWVGYDNEDMVARKAQYAKEKQLGGIMFWTLDMDDFRGSCSPTKSPLIKAGRRALGLTVSNN